MPPGIVPSGEGRICGIACCMPRGAPGLAKSGKDRICIIVWGAAIPLLPGMDKSGDGRMGDAWSVTPAAPGIGNICGGDAET